MKNLHYHSNIEAYLDRSYALGAVLNVVLFESSQTSLVADTVSKLQISVSEGVK